MTSLFFVFYNVLRVPLFLIAKIAGLFNEKVGETFLGRKKLFAVIAEKLKNIPVDARRIWVHASSMGEYEQALPLVNELLARDASAWIVLTLFSPSVMKHISDPGGRIVLFYLPFDSNRNVVRFLDAVKPCASIVIRHDIWPNYQWHLQKRGVPSILADASISDKRVNSAQRLSAYYKQVFNTFSAVCAVSDQQAERLKMVYSTPDNIFTCGDTRFDRVRERALDKSKIANVIASNLFTRERCLVVGSSWEEDEKVIFPAVSKALRKYEDFTLVIAPHELTPEHISSIETYFDRDGVELIRWSRFDADHKPSTRVLLVDTIGLLANLYTLGSITYVGGAFGLGVHSVLEPAAHGVLISFGPGYLNSHEASDMAGKVSTSITTSEDFDKFLMTALKDPQETARRGKKTLDYIQKQFGASSRTADIVEKYIS